MKIEEDDKILSKFIGVDLHEILFFKMMSIDPDGPHILLQTHWTKKSRLSQEFFEKNLSMLEKRKNFITSYFHGIGNLLTFRFYPLDEYLGDFFKLINY